MTSIFNSHIKKAKETFGIHFTLREQQLQALKAVYDGKDTFCMLRTGFGKSLIYQLTPILLGLKTNNSKCITLVVSPLNSIMHDQVRKLASKGITACALDMQCRQGETYKFRSAADDSSEDSESDTEDVAPVPDGLLKMSVSIDDVRSGKYQLVYAHPEAFLSSTTGRAMLRSQFFRKNVCCVAIDEAHMIDEWGESFRKDFSRLKDILAHFHDIPALVVTATASPATRRKLIDDLGLRKPCIIIAHPDRSNIMYFKKERLPSVRQHCDLDEILHEISTGLRDEQLNYPLTVMYCDLEIIRYVYRYLETALSESQYIGEPCPENRIFAMYHQAYTDRMKSHIIAELTKGTSSRVRFVVATVALGMGLDAPAIRKVIHFKSPTSIEKYLQETGRAGRDGVQAEAILYYNQTDLRSNRPGQQQAMVDYCKMNTGCMREKLMQYLDCGVPQNRMLCKCCQFCRESCECGKC